MATTGEHHARLAAHLTQRDRWLARMLHEHKVFTTHQIVDLAFPSVRAANHRLLDLHRWRVLDRFQPFVTIGTAPMHYVLDIAGAFALAHEDGIDPKVLRYRHEQAIGIAHSLRLGHTVGANGFFTSLVRLARRPDAGCALTAWWSETRCARHFGDIVQPDGYGRWREQHQHDVRETEFFLEFDFGTEPMNRLAAKLRRYEELATKTGITTPVLFWLPSTSREANARRAFGTALRLLDQPQLVPVATASADQAVHDDAPAAAVWLPIPEPGTPGRSRLAELGAAWPQLTPVTTVPPARRDRTIAADSTSLIPPEPMPPDEPASRTAGAC